MPDPGEPHMPREEDYESTADYIDAVEAFTQARLTPTERQIRFEAIKMQIEIQKFLEEQK
jgi:hypothetical protein